MKYTGCVAVHLAVEVCSKIFEEFVRMKINWHVIFLLFEEKDKFYLFTLRAVY